MDDTGFLDQAASDDGTSTAILRVQLPDGSVCQISDSISIYQLIDCCPLLYHAFEYGHLSRPQASVEASSVSSVISLLRYCYTGSYMPLDHEYDPSMFLPHAETYKIAENFGMPELQLLAHGNFSSQVEFACCMPEPPHDLIDTIRFMYRHLSSHKSRQQQGLLSTLLNYCIASFPNHKLGDNLDFLHIAQEIPEFRQDLCRTNMDRNFEDDCAFEIIRLALDTLSPYSLDRPNTLASRDLPEEMLVDRPETPPSLPRPTEDHESDSTSTTPTLINLLPMESPLNELTIASSSTALPCRPKAELSKGFESFEPDFSGEDEGFSIVKGEPMSSPELVPSTPVVDVLALTGSAYPEDDDDDEWTTIGMEL